MAMFEVLPVFGFRVSNPGLPTDHISQNSIANSIVFVVLENLVNGKQRYHQAG